MDLLTPEENLIVHVARATCFSCRFEAGEVPEGDIQLYVDELIALFRRKPAADLVHTPEEEPLTLAGTLQFCAEQLDQIAPEQASKLRAALEGAP